MRQRNACLFVLATAVLFASALAVEAARWPWNRVSAYIEANPNTVAQGESSTLYWSAENASSATLNGEAVGAIGDRVVTPDKTTAYDLTAQGRRRSVTATATVIVTEPEPPVPDPVPPEPLPPPVPPEPLPPPVPGDLWGAILIEETRARTPALAAVITSVPVNKFFDDRGLAFRVADQDVKGPDNKTPADLAPYIEKAKAAGLPRLFIVDKTNAVLSEGSVPATPQAMIDFVSQHIKPPTMKEPDPSCPGGVCPTTRNLMNRIFPKRR